MFGSLCANPVKALLAFHHIAWLTGVWRQVLLFALYPLLNSLFSRDQKFQAHRFGVTERRSVYELFIIMRIYYSLCNLPPKLLLWDNGSRIEDLN